MNLATDCRGFEENEQVYGLVERLSGFLRGEKKKGEGSRLERKRLKPARIGKFGKNGKGKLTPMTEDVPRLWFNALGHGGRRKFVLIV